MVRGLMEDDMDKLWKVAMPIPVAVLDCWGQEFESRWGHECSSCIVYVAASPTGWLLVHRSPTGCVFVNFQLSVNYEPQQWGGLGPSWALTPKKIKTNTRKWPCLNGSTTEALSGRHWDNTPKNLILYLKRAICQYTARALPLHPTAVRWTYELRSEVKKAFQLRPKVSPACVSYRDTTKPPDQTGKRTRSAARDTHTHTHTHMHHTHARIQRHHPVTNASTLSTTTLYLKCMAFRNVSHVLVVTLMCKLISCSKHSAFFDTKHCWFLLASTLIFKNPQQTGDIFWRISLYCTPRTSFRPKRVVK